MAAPLRRCILGCAALTVIYFAVPVHAVSGFTELAVRVGACLAALIGLVIALKHLMVRGIERPGSPLEGLVIGIVAGLLLFAFADYALAHRDPAQFEGLRTRLDALYFALTTVLTVGFGDITARGQFARGLLCAQMAFNVVILASAASFLAKEIGVRARSGR